MRCNLERRTAVTRLGITFDKHLQRGMATRATKFKASVHKRDVDDVDSHFEAQLSALPYDCSMRVTEKDGKYTLHVQRNDGLKMS